MRIIGLFPAIKGVFPAIKGVFPAIEGVIPAKWRINVYSGETGSSSLLVKRYKLTCGRTPLAGLVFSLNDT